jgi:hypothetical protein
MRRFLLRMALLAVSSPVEAQGGHCGTDAYGGRINAEVELADGGDLRTRLLVEGVVVAYDDKGRKPSWCGRPAVHPAGWHRGSSRAPPPPGRGVTDSMVGPAVAHPCLRPPARAHSSQKFTAPSQRAT